MLIFLKQDVKISIFQTLEKGPEIKYYGWEYLPGPSHVHLIDISHFNKPLIWEQQHQRQMCSASPIFPSHQGKYQEDLLADNEHNETAFPFFFFKEEMYNLATHSLL